MDPIKMMITMKEASLLLLFAIICTLLCRNVEGRSSKKHRHTLYWNTFMTPELKTGDYVKEVEIGEFMDILCPHKGLVGITTGPKLIEFDIYNVTQDLYENCQSGGRRNMIFACNRPERENKLTIKFQVVSPSPLGFKFQYCNDYYLVALPRNRVHQTGCHKESTRMKISVKCKHTTTAAPPPTTTTATTTTATTTTTPTTTTTTTTTTVQPTTAELTTSQQQQQVVTTASAREGEDMKYQVIPRASRRSKDPNNSSTSSYSLQPSFIHCCLVIVAVMLNLLS